MSDPTQFSYTFSLGGDKELPEEASLFAMDCLNESPQPDGNVLVQNRRNGRQMVLPEEVLSALSYCTEFRNLEGHVAALMQGNPAGPGKEAAIRSVVKAVHDGGLTVSAQEICDRLEPMAGVSREFEKPVVTILTWERPQALRRLLDSLLTNCDQRGIERCYVIDDSRSQESKSSNRAITAAANDQAELRIEYFGEKEAADLLARLISRLPGQENEIRFLLDRDHWSNYWTCGVSRNYSQILSVGRPLVMADDDAIFDVYEVPFSEAGVEFSSRPRHAEFFHSQQDWPPVATNGQRDPIALHMRFIGLSIPQVLGTLGQDKPRVESLKHSLSMLAGRLHAKSRILVSECGSLGDPGTGSNTWLPDLPLESRERLLRDEATLASAMRQRNCWSGRPRPTFTRSSNMSQLTCLDNRDFLPPYFPFGRVEDRLFGDLTGFVFLDGVTLDQNWATPHLPIPERFWTEKDNDFTMRSSFPGDLLYPPERLYTECLSDQPKMRLHFLAGYYHDLAACPEQDLLSAFTDGWHLARDAKRESIQKNIESPAGASEAWLNYLQTARQRLQASRLLLSSAEDLVSNGLQISGSELLEFWRESWSRFGHSLVAWQDIREAAREVIGIAENEKA